VEVLFCSLHGRAEFISAAHRKVREGTATLAQLRALLAQLHADTSAGALRWLPVTDAHIARVESVYLTAPASTYLRAVDALHLASAAEQGFVEIYSHDRHLLAAAPLFGLRGVTVIL
jgi:predicted nucleic acid-binding protein